MRRGVWLAQHWQTAGEFVHAVHHGLEEARVAGDIDNGR